MEIQKQIHELSERGTPPDADNILHTQDPGNFDVRMTIQDILDLVPDNSGGDPGLLSGGIDTSNDGVVLSDNSSSDALRRVPWATFLAEFSFPTITQTLGDPGQFNIGNFQLRWGTATSTQDSSEDFTFTPAFSTNCFVVLVTRKNADGSNSMQAYTWDKDGFSVDRDSSIDGTSQEFVYFAVGE